MSSALKFYSGARNASSWAMRAWLALREAGLTFEEEVVDIRRPQRFVNLARLANVTPTGCVPALVTDGGVIFDSLAIMEYANDRAGGRLLPSDMTLRARARSLVAWQHAGLPGICGRISFESAFYPLKRPLTPAEEQQCAHLFGVADRFLAETGGPFLCGDLSLADLAMAPAVIRLTRHQADLTDYPRVVSWTEALLDRPAVREWMGQADQLVHIWYDDYLAAEPAATTWRNAGLSA